jgi:FixJ family two-component response regulator
MLGAQMIDRVAVFGEGSAMSEPIVHIVDDDAAVRASLDSLFQSVGLGTRQHGTAQSFLDSGEADQAGCLVLDVRLPGVSGLDFQDRLNACGVRMPVVFMTGHGDIPMSVRGMKAGAVDFLAKPFRDQDMLDAVAAALDRDRAARSESVELAALRAMYAQLSPREKQVLGMVATGLLNKQIAHELGLSEITVKVHRSAATRKMGARNMVELLKMSQTLGIGA